MVWIKVFVSDIIWSRSSIDNQFLSLSNIDGKCDTFRTFYIVICIKLRLKFKEEKKITSIYNIKCVNLSEFESLLKCDFDAFFEFYIYSDFIILLWICPTVTDLRAAQRFIRFYLPLRFGGNEGGDEEKEKKYFFILEKGRKSSMNVQK